MSTAGSGWFRQKGRGRRRASPATALYGLRTTLTAPSSFFGGARSPGARSCRGRAWVQRSSVAKRSSSSRSDRVSSLHRRTFAWPVATASADSRLIHSSSISSAGAKATEGDVRCRLGVGDRPWPHHSSRGYSSVGRQAGLRHRDWRLAGCPLAPSAPGCAAAEYRVSAFENSDPLHQDRRIGLGGEGLQILRVLGEHDAPASLSDCDDDCIDGRARASTCP